MANLDLVSEQSLKVNLLVLPGLFAGIFIGRKVIQIIPQRGFEILLYAFSTIAGLRLFFLKRLTKRYCVVQPPSTPSIAPVV